MKVTRLLSLSLLGVVLVGCSSDDDVRVQAEPVGRADVAEVVEAPGTIAARAVASLTAPTAAIVEAVLVKDGAQVAKGAVLARLSSPAAQERLQQALAAQAQASGAAGAASGGERGPDLGSVQDSLDAAARQSFAAGRSAAGQVQDPAARQQAERQIAQAERQYLAASEAARAAVRRVTAGADGIGQALAAVAGTQRAQAGAAVDSARATVDALTVRAPIAGVVSLGGSGAPPTTGGGDLAGLISGLPAAVQGPAAAALGGAGGGADGGSGTGSGTTTSAGLSAGAEVAGGAALFTVTDLAGLTVSAEVDETDVLLVKAGTTAQVEVDAVPGATYPATVTAVDLAPTMSARGGVSYRVRLTLRSGTIPDADQAPAPRPGMSAVVALRVREAKDALAVPSAAVVRDGGRPDAVFVIEDGRAVRREVRLGAQGADVVEVLSGLEQGARVVVRDADRLSDGQAVTS